MFCRHYIASLDEDKSAELAGYNLEKEPFAGKKLLAKPDIIREIKEQIEEENKLLPQLTKQLMKKIAFADVTDAMFYASHYGDLTKEEIAKLNLLAVSEVKVKQEAIELKFHDKTKLLERLRTEENMQETIGADKFYRALAETELEDNLQIQREND